MKKSVRFRISFDRAGRPAKLLAMDLVRIEKADGVGTITLNDPDRRNAVSLAMNAQLAEIMTDLEADDSINALVITGAPPAFCAGADLSQLGDSAEEGLLDIYEGFLRVGRSPLPTIAAVNGAAVGAGMNLALICDVRSGRQVGEVRRPVPQLGYPSRRRPHLDVPKHRWSAGCGSCGAVRRGSRAARKR